MQCAMSRWVRIKNSHLIVIHLQTKCIIDYIFLFFFYSYFGQNCNQICKCKNFARCRKNDGYCICNDGWMGAHCEDVCPEGTTIRQCRKPMDLFLNEFRLFFSTGFFGKHCMDFCSCPSPQFVCHAAHGCVCRVGFSGTDCLTPKGQYQELHNGNIDGHFR